MADLADELKSEVGQHFVFGFTGEEVSKDAMRLIRDFHVGSIILMRRNVKSIPQVHALVQGLQRVAREAGHERPLMIGIDQENGLVSAFSSSTGKAGTLFPGAMALAATASTDLAEEVSRATGREMKLAGINWAYSPVADVNSDPRNPVIGVRSFGDDPHKVGEYASAVGRGLSSAGIAASAKHFPGHGDTHTDSHHALPVIPKTTSSLDDVELVPFRTLIREGVATIMTAHIALPQVTGNNAPASLSRRVTTGLLREELGFKGVVVTDCLEMDAVAGTVGTGRGAVEALKAGADVVMICHTLKRQVGAVKAVYDALRSGELSVEELRSSGERIRKLKDEYAGTWESVLGDTLDLDVLAALKRENALLSSRAYSASTAWLDGSVGFDPMRKGTKVVLFTPRGEAINPAVDDEEDVPRGSAGNRTGASYIVLAACVAKFAGPENSRHVVYAPIKEKGTDLPEEYKAALADAECIIFVTRNAHTSTWQRAILQRVLDYDRTREGSGAGQARETRVVAVASCGPYDLAGQNAGDEKDANWAKVPCLCTFEFTRPALEAAAAVVFGEMCAKGKVPVDVFTRW